jgi:hypothetical protein
MSDQHCPTCGFVRFDHSPLEPPPERCPRCATRGRTEQLRPTRWRPAAASGAAENPSMAGKVASRSGPSTVLR